MPIRNGLGRPFPHGCRAKPEGSRVSGWQGRSLGPGQSIVGDGGLAGAPTAGPLPSAPPQSWQTATICCRRELRRKGCAERHRQRERPAAGRRDVLQDSKTRNSAHGRDRASETLPVFSKPYNDFFCSSSSCCLLCLHTKHLKDKDSTTLPAVRRRDRGPRTLGTDTGLR